MMPLKKLQLKPGVNRENTRYANEGTWYDCDKVRFRSGSPEKIGGWLRISSDTFLGVCRSLGAWVTLTGSLLRGVGTNLKFYVEEGGLYNDITPIRDVENLSDPFGTTNGSPIVVVTDAAGGFVDGDFVTFSGASAVGGLTIAGEFQLTFLTPTTYSITADSPATSTATGGGTVTATYQINVGFEVAVPLSGWGAGPWSAGPWGVGTVSSNQLNPLRVWTQSNFGEDLVFGPSLGPLYYWDASSGVINRGVLLSSLPGSSNVPLIHNQLLVSDISRFVFVFGTNELGDSAYDPLLVRWSDQENAVDWTPSPLNQAGSIRLSRGSSIVAARQSRQEILVWTDTSLYSLQFVGAPEVWSTQLVGENISVISDRAVAYASGMAFWMGAGRFYAYDGRAQFLPCDVRKYVFEDFNFEQTQQVFSGTNEEFHEIWWFYCSKNSTVADRYVVFNYLDNLWYFGTLERSAWLDSSASGLPVAATYVNNLVIHEQGSDDRSSNIPAPIAAFVESAQFDIDDGDDFSFVWRILPDVSFEGSENETPAVTMTLIPLRGSGSGYNSPRSVGGVSSSAVVRSSTFPVEQYTDQVNIRVRGRQLVLRVESDAAGVAWQLGTPRIDLRPDGRA
jgi:hypothetical protein